MSADGSRRFTDREVALVLQEAAELDEVGGRDPGGSLSREDLEEIAREVGISPESIAQAVARVGTGRRQAWNLSGAPLTHRSVHVVPRKLEPGALNGLIRLVDEKADAAGSVSEALGSVRWTSSDRFRSTQVVLTPQDGETAIQVVEKASARLRRVVHLLPTAWSMILFGGLASSLASSPLSGLALLGVGGATGFAVGRAVWSLLSGRSEKRVERLAAELVREGTRAGVDT